MLNAVHFSDKMDLFETQICVALLHYIELTEQAIKVWQFKVLLLSSHMDIIKTLRKRHLFFCIPDRVKNLSVREKQKINKKPSEFI